VGIEGVIEISSFGGFVKQYEVSVDPERLRSQNVTLSELFDALQKTTPIPAVATLNVWGKRSLFGAKGS
jgi:Cu/Ag efflux pump CusA